MSDFENYDDVVRQMQAYGLQPKLPLKVGARKTCGPKGKCWYKLHDFRRDSGRVFLVGSFGCYSPKLASELGLPADYVKVDVDWKGVSDEERSRMATVRQAAEEQQRRDREEASAHAAMTASQLWHDASRTGESEYLKRKGVQGDAVRYIARDFWLGRRDPTENAFRVPRGTIVLPLLRYDVARDDALRGLQFIKPDGFKFFTEGFAASGCALRLGTVDASTRVVLVCEGYVTGLSIREATGRRWPVYVALNAGNLAPVCEILRKLHPGVHLLICADDDWKSADYDGTNPGRRKAWKVAKATSQCDVVWPVFDHATRGEKDTDFNDLHAREGLEAVERQLVRVLTMIEAGGATRG